MEFRNYCEDRSFLFRFFFFFFFFLIFFSLFLKNKIITNSILTSYDVGTALIVANPRQKAVRDGLQSNSSGERRYCCLCERSALLSLKSELGGQKRFFHLFSSPCPTNNANIPVAIFVLCHADYTEGMLGDSEVCLWVLAEKQNENIKIN